MGQQGPPKRCLPRRGPALKLSNRRRTGAYAVIQIGGRKVHFGYRAALDDLKGTSDFGNAMPWMRDLIHLLPEETLYMLDSDWTSLSPSIGIFGSS